MYVVESFSGPDQDPYFTSHLCEPYTIHMNGLTLLHLGPAIMSKIDL